jgi:hypothetical protein
MGCQMSVHKMREDDWEHEIHVGTMEGPCTSIFVCMGIDR